jgi:hypothetical protein
MWISPQIGNTPLQQNNPIPNQQSNAQFTPRSVGLFHARSGGFPPFLGNNFSPNPTSGNSTSFPFKWNWNANTSLGPQNVGLAFFGSSSQQLGNNPSFGPVGGTHPLGQQLMGSQPISTPQQNVQFNPHSTQPLGGTTGFSQQTLGQVQPLSHFQQMGGSNAPLNPSMQFGKGLQQHQQPLTWEHSFLNHHINSPMLGLVMSLQILPPKGAVIINPVGINPGALMPLGDLKLSVMSLLQEDLALPNKVDFPYHIPTSPKWGDMLSFMEKWAKIPNRGYIKM